jgi:hypothetical protein
LENPPRQYYDRYSWDARGGPPAEYRCIVIAASGKIPISVRFTKRDLMGQKECILALIGRLKNKLHSDL